MGLDGEVQEREVCELGGGQAHDGGSGDMEGWGEEIYDKGVCELGGRQADGRGSGDMEAICLGPPFVGFRCAPCLVQTHY